MESIAKVGEEVEASGIGKEVRRGERPWQDLQCLRGI